MCGTYLQEYMRRTKTLRGTHDQPFLCYQKPHTPAKKDTVSNWVKRVLRDAGISDFAPHSFRAASSSAMLQCGVDLDDILTSAGWSNIATFQQFYNRSVEGKPKEKQPSGNSLLKYFQRK